MDTADRIHNLPVPERFLPLMTRTLADAYAAEAAAEGGGAAIQPLAPVEGGSPIEWTREEVMRAYREGTPALRAAFDYLADHPEEEVRSRDLARAVYPNDSDDDAESRVYGVLGGFGTKAANRYGKKAWFFSAYRERMPDGSAGYFVYVMPAQKAAWLREASGRD
jgi:hypothetical protein